MPDSKWVNKLLYAYLYRELVDAECYRLAYEFVCQLLQPSCTIHLPGEAEDKMILPCRSFCREFHAGCGNRIPTRFKDALDCMHFPEFTGPGSCNSKPGIWQSRGYSLYQLRICEGTLQIKIFNFLSCLISIWNVYNSMNCTLKYVLYYYDLFLILLSCD